MLLNSAAPFLNALLENVPVYSEAVLIKPVGCVLLGGGSGV